MTPLDDQQQRQSAIDPTHSCIVQAPAGSGKTELLIQRTLSLLASVNQPEEVLAITFTRKAAGEMKARLLEALDLAASGIVPTSAHARQTFDLASAVLQRDHHCGWDLVGNPSRLQVMTIDSFSAGIARRMPWLSRFGMSPRLSDAPDELYRQAVEELLSQLEGEGSISFAALLQHVDNRLSTLRDLLVALLGRRDQWLRHLLGARAADARPVLEAGLQRYIEHVLQQVSSSFGDEEITELVTLGRYAANAMAEFGDTTLAARLADIERSPVAEASEVVVWQTLAQLLLTTGGTLRKSIDKRCGFPADKVEPALTMKQRMLDLLANLRGQEGLETLLVTLCSLPEPNYREDQWQILEALITLLPQAVIALQEVFRRRAEVDFVEVAAAARLALGEVDAPEDLLLQLDSRLRHILVDEFQDTSYGQYDLLQRLTSGWERGDGRTLFVVGDPMQSIYRFREAEVGLYLRTRAVGLPDVDLTPLVLTSNFRSQQCLVDWFNETFSSLFPLQEDVVRGAVPYATAAAVLPALPLPAVQVCAFAERDDAAEAAAVLSAIHAAQVSDPQGSIAILVRARSHAPAIIAALKAAGLPFQSQEIDLLAERSVVQDLRALTRALLQVADRVCWLAILRAPWCGLQLADLLALCEQAGATAPIWSALSDGTTQPALFGLSDEARQRLARIVPVLEQGLRSRGELTLRHLVESVWIKLGGPACIDAMGLADARRFFDLLDELEEGGDLPYLDRLDERLTTLYASPDPASDDSLQLMTIHKAKGLEFDRVLLPGMGRGVRRGDRPLLRWLEHPDYKLLLAPVPASDESDEGATYRAIGRLQQEKDDFELLRLFYVAATRARKQLLLFGHVPTTSKDELSPESGSLLAAAWPTLADSFAAALSGVVPAPVAPIIADLPLLCRLPVEWQLPVLPQWGLFSGGEVRRASDSANMEREGVPLLPGPARLVGIVVHQWLERIANSGVDAWSVKRIKAAAAQMRVELAVAGVAARRLDTALQQVQACLHQALESKRGQWLLAARDGAAAEYALHGVIDGEIVHAVIDRTFVAAGERWAIDYKTSAPAEGETLPVFLAREATRYQPQLSLYLHLLQALEPQHRVRGGLYFPMIDGWVEMD